MDRSRLLRIAARVAIDPIERPDSKPTGLEGQTAVDAYNRPTGQEAAPKEPGHPSELKEGEYAVYQQVGGGYIMYHRNNGKLWMTESSDPQSFDPNDAEEVEDAQPVPGVKPGEQQHTWTTTGMEFVERGMM